MIIKILIGFTLFYLLAACSTNHSLPNRYIIGEDRRWKDLHLNGKERNFSAFSNELLKSIAKQENFELGFTDTLDPMKELQEGKLQGVLTHLKANYSNEKLLFSDPYFLIGPVLITSKNSNTKYSKNEETKIIGVPPNTPLLSNLQQDPTIQIKFYDDILTALADLRNGQIDGAIFPVIPSYIYTETFYKQELKIATPPLTDDGVRLVAFKNDAGKVLIEKFNQGLKTLKEEGTFQKMLYNWGFTDVEQVKP